MIGWLIGVPAVLGAVVTAVTLTRMIYMDSTRSRYAERDGESAAFALFIGIMVSPFWPVIAIGFFLRRMFKKGVFDIIFLDTKTRQELRMRERDARVRRMEYEAREHELRMKRAIENRW